MRKSFAKQMFFGETHSKIFVRELIFYRTTPGNCFCLVSRVSFIYKFVISIIALGIFIIKCVG